MHEEAQAVVVAERQAGEPGQMGLLDAAAGAGVVALRGGAAVLQPQCHGALVGMRHDRHLLVVAAQADHGAGLRLLPPHQPFDDAAAVGAAVDIVAEKDVARGPPAGMGLAGRGEPLELVETAVDVADREGED